MIPEVRKTKPTTHQLPDQLESLIQRAKALDWNPIHLDREVAEARALVNRARARARLGDYLGAIDDTSSALKLPDHGYTGPSHEYRGIFLAELGYHGQAIEDFSEALTTGQTGLRYFRRAICQAALGRDPAAMADYAAALLAEAQFLAGLPYQAVFDTNAWSDACLGSGPRFFEKINFLHRHFSWHPPAWRLNLARVRSALAQRTRAYEDNSCAQ